MRFVSRSTGRHSAAAPVRSASRPRRLVAAVLGFLLMAGAGAAAAAFFSEARVKGEVKAGAFSAFWLRDSGSNGIPDVDYVPQDDTTAEGTPIGTTLAGTAATWVGTGSTGAGNSSAFPEIATPTGTKAPTVMPGEALRISVPVVLRPNSAVSGYVSGLSGSLPAGWEAEITAGCAAAVKALPPSTAGSTVEEARAASAPVVIVLKPGADATSPVDLGAAGLAVQVTPYPRNSGGTAPAGTSCPALVGAAS